MSSSWFGETVCDSAFPYDGIRRLSACTRVPHREGATY